MRLPGPIGRFYEAHETPAKLSAFLIFLVVVASLYVVVLRSNPSTTTVLVSTPTPSPLATATPTALATSTTPGVVATIPPPIPLGRYQVTTQTNLAYGVTDDLAERLDLCMPVGATGPRPGVLLIHGGGFVQGDKSSYDSLCSAFASYGFVVATMNYRLAPQTVWPAPLVDAQLAVRWLRANASQNHLDPTRLCALGDSAGGNLSVFLGVLATIHAGDHANLLSTESPGVACVVDEFGPIDMTQLTDSSSWEGLFSDMFGQANQNNPVFLRDASPVFDVTAQSAPTLIIQGSIDVTVPPSQSEELQRKLQAANVGASYISYTGGHSFDGLSGQQIKAINLQILSFLTSQEHP